MADKTAAELKREKEMEARRAMFVKGSNDRPANSDLSSILGEDAASTPEPIAEPPGDDAQGKPEDADAGQAAGEAAQEAAALEPVQAEPRPAAKPATPAKTAPTAKKSPWAKYMGPKQKGFTTEFEIELDAKIDLVVNTLPALNRTKLVKRAVEEFVNKVIAEHYK